MNKTMLTGLCALLAGAGAVRAQSTAFTYQGRLNVANGTATGLYDFSFNLYAASSGGSALTASNGFFAMPVTSGVFSVTLDFGSQFPGADRWLGIAVRTNGVGGFATLAPRQTLTPTPYAIRATSAGTAVTASSVAAGAVNGTALAANSVDSSKIADGSIVAGDLSFGLLSNTFWRLTGNAGTTTGPNFVGTTDNQPFEAKVNGMRALRLEPGTTANVIGGFNGNSVAAGIVGATIGGGGASGFPNRVNATYGAVAGGLGNSVFHNDSFIGAGIGNSISSDRAVIAGGRDNSIQTNASNSAIGGGLNNSIDQASRSVVIGGGQGNKVGFSSYAATIAGGLSNRLEGLNDTSTIGGGRANAMNLEAIYATISGGWSNVIGGESSSGTIGGGENNTVARSKGGTVGGGLRNSTGNFNQGVTIGGGVGNGVGLYSDRATIGGGGNNFVDGGGAFGTTDATIGGGFANLIDTGADSSTIGGGKGNQITNSSINATIAGGGNNRISASYATVPGGSFNVAAGAFSFAAGTGAQANHPGSFVWSDSQGSFSSTADNQFNIRAGGGVRLSSDTPSLSFDDDASSILFPPSSGANAPMIHLFRSGTENAPRMVLAHSPTYANWGLQYEDTPDKFHFVNTGIPVMTVDLGTQRVGIGTPNPSATSAKLTVLGSTVGGFVNPLVYLENTNTVGNSGPALRVKGGGNPLDGVLSVSSHGIGLIARFGNASSWVSSLDTNGNWCATSFNPCSDRNVKENFAPVDAQGVLEKVAALPISTWNYKQDAGSKHIGPMAQDFWAAFGAGMDDKHIATVDADGVALAAIQGLNEKVEKQLQAKDAEIRELRQSLAELKSLIQVQGR